MTVVLVINSGSSSLKYSLRDAKSERELAHGLIERIGQTEGIASHTVRTHAQPGEPAKTVLEVTHSEERPIADHDDAFALMLELFRDHGPALEDTALKAVGHRVVHGGDQFFAPTLITDDIVERIDELSMLAPLHNPANAASIRAARAVFRDVPHVAVFDTAFLQTLQPAAYSYAIDAATAREHKVRRYGFHGTSHKYVSERAAEFTDKPADGLRQIVLHLGNGASMTAVHDGRAVETSMGLTPLEGLVMGTRSGDIDPAVLFHLNRQTDMKVAELDDLLNKRSGLLGMAGRSDMRDILDGLDAGEPEATLAYEVYIHRLRAYLGAYIAQLGGVDVISFTAGVGENAARVRADAVATLGFLGARIDEERNTTRGHGIRRISTDDSAIEILVVPTDEELEIAKQALTVA